MAMSMMNQGIKVVAQKADPDASISKGLLGGFQSTVINVFEDGSERVYRVSSTRKRDLVTKLGKLPLENVKGMTLKDGFYSMSLFEYNGV